MANDKAQGGKRAAMEADDGGSRNREIVLREEQAEFAGAATTTTGPDLDGPAWDDRTPDQGAVTGVSMERGLNVLRTQLKTLPDSPGVYRMLDGRGDPLYVGKAKNLKRRVANYTQIPRLPTRLQRMVAECVDMEIVVTHTEVEALLLESNLIKRFMPRFNVLLRDDKSFPYILIRTDHEFPQITKHRGAQKIPGDYFGPFASAGAVNRTLTALEKAFLLRSCTDHVFENRTRPCLLYQIKRCAAPCVEKVSKTDYDGLVGDSRAFLFGQSSKIQSSLASEMQEAAEDLDFERAARIRDRIRALTAVQAKQDINIEGAVEEADVIAAYQASGQTCIQVFFFRAGRNYGNRSYFPSHDRSMGPAEILAAFIAQFYDDKPTPKTVLVSEAPAEIDLLSEALTVRAGRKIDLSVPQRGARRKIMAHALTNAREALSRRQAESSTQKKLLDGLAERLGLEPGLERIEVYDNSHLQGTNAYGCMIVAGTEGFIKGAYRKWTFKSDIAPGDDYAMMREVFTRRFKRALKEREEAEAAEMADDTWPDLVLIDGGKGQLSAVQAVMDELGIDDVNLCAVAKGPDRDAGREVLFQPDKAPLQLPTNDPVLFFIQRMRDEAHRFAIGTHRAKRSKQLSKSLLDDVPNIGPARKKALLHHFGSAKQVARAGVSDLAKVDGISGAIAQKIYDHFNTGSGAA